MDRKILLTVASLALLASCDNESCFTGVCNGGGSGGGQVGAGGTIILNQDNFVDAVREAWYAMEVSAAVPALVVATGVGDTSGGVVTFGGPSAKAMCSMVALDPFGPTVYNCVVSGTLTVTGDIRRLPRPGIGFQVQLDANGSSNHEVTIQYTWEEFFAL